MWLIYPLILHDALQPINKNIESGDWSTLICYMNCIACAAPKNRTILIIREITNLERQSLHECLRSMEKLKEHRVAFPIVLETSNFLWFDLPSVKIQVII